jgi:Leucine-rich repeat (LRR) protein
MRRLALLDLSGANITDAGLSNLVGLTRLEELDLPGTMLSDAGLRHLAGLRRIEELDLRATHVGTAGLRHLIGLTRLEQLYLMDTRVDDGAAEVLEQLKNLQRVELNGSAVGAFGYWKLFQAIPRCFPYHVYSHYWGWVERGGKAIGPEKFASETDERGRTIFRLLMLRCFLREDSDGRIVAARIDVTSPMASAARGDSYRETRETLDLLVKLGSIESLHVENCGPKPSPPLDDFVVASFANFQKLRDLHVFGCLLSERGWTLVASLSRLQELHLCDGRIMKDQIERIQRALPKCKIDQWP